MMRARWLPIAIAGALALAPGALAGGAAPGTVVRVEHRDPAALPARGSRAAPVTVELFFSPGTHSKTQAFRNVEALQAKHPTRIRLVYRVVLSAGGAMLPNAALEAQAAGKFDDFMAELNAAPTNLTRPKIVELGKKVGIDPDRMLAAINENRYDRVLRANDRRLRRRRGAAYPSALFNGKLASAPLSVMQPDGLEKEYAAAYERALDLIDRGADPRRLPIAFDEEALDGATDPVVQLGQVDEDIDTSPVAQPRLASPPLDLHGLPALGPADAAVTIVVACKPTSANCNGPLRAARTVQDLFPDSVRVTWAPYFDVSTDEAADQSLLADAALCAEQVGTGTIADVDQIASQGWHWVDQMLVEWSSRRRHVPAATAIDRVADKLHVDARQFADCRARIAGASVAWIEAARRAGLRTSPATVVGGRVYGPIVDPNTLQALVASELAPGALGQAAPTWRR